MAWLIVAAEAREIAHIRKRDGWLFAVSGPGSKLVGEILRERQRVEGIVSTGFCGALDPELKIGDIVQGNVISMDRVVVTAPEKRSLREQTGAAAVDMEAATVEAKAREWGVPFRCVKVVSDTAHQDMPLDFNLYRDRTGRFSRGRIALAAIARPFTRMPGLLLLDRNCRTAAEKLGEFFADCEF